MKYLYTNSPDDGCAEVSPGIYGRPVHTSHQSKLRKLGWKDNPDDLRQNEEIKQEAKAEEEPVSTWQGMTVHEQAEAMGIATHDEDGKKIHHKTLKKLIEEAQAND